MTDMQKEKLSAFLDGEIDSSAEVQQTIDWLLKDDAAKTSWSSLCTSRDVLHGTERRASVDFASGVMAALESEPTLLVPAARHELKNADKPETGSAKPSGVVRFLKPVAGFAVAATVAAVTVFSVDSLNTTQTNTTFTTAGVHSAASNNVLQATTQPVAQTAIMPVTFTGTYDVNDRTYWQGSDEAMQDELNGYLANHVDYANPGGYQSMMPYVRLAGYDSNQ